MHTAHELSDELRPKARALRDEIGGVFSGYAEMSQAALSAGALSVRVKELIALAIAATRECDGCIGAHAGSPARGSECGRGRGGHGRGDHDERRPRDGLGSPGVRRVRRMGRRRPARANK